MLVALSIQANLRSETRKVLNTYEPASDRISPSFIRCPIYSGQNEIRCPIYSGDLATQYVTQKRQCPI